MFLYPLRPPLPSLALESALSTTTIHSCTGANSHLIRSITDDLAPYYPATNFTTQGFSTAPEEKLSLSTCSEDDLDM
ncbi:hypothetical protein ANCCAN_14746 [Ancylostoma caninum]|uniref:Uncharacterized protein n=1 Tax=Ancylostoma caninum TaxID=29170 RepID=A0A368G4H0_ANCCA|nr:hypothetical protein ANCCAN_14746 [Ancylostoma caninum]